MVYENEEFNLLQHALNIEEGYEDLRYNNIVIATDADVDGMHIRLLLMTFFLQFFPDLVKNGHVYILETPLFRVRTMPGKTKKNRKRFIVMMKMKNKKRLKNWVASRRSRGLKDWEKFLRKSLENLLAKI